MRKVKNTILILWVAIITLFFNSKVIYADCSGLWTYNVQEALEAEMAEYESAAAGCREGRFVTCAVWNSYNEEDVKASVDVSTSNSIKDYSSAMFREAILAGTFIGIDAYETYKITFHVGISATCIERELVRGTVRVPCDCNENGYETKETWVCETHMCTPKPEECYDKAGALLDSLADGVNHEPAFVGLRQDVNDINDGYITEVKEDSQEIDRGTNSFSGWTGQRTVTVIYTYNLGAAWMDPVTGNVKYEGDSRARPQDRLTEEDKKTYIRVPSNMARGWLYFIPLNTKSTDSFTYTLGSSGNRLYGHGLCEDIIDNYDDSSSNEYWGYLLTDENGNKLSELATTQEQAKKYVKNGCYLRYTGIVNIIQKFYHEIDTKNGKVLSGYNFYYRPIDYGNPFPNGIAVDSYWKKTYNPSSNAVTVNSAACKKEDLDESYNNVTYATNEDYNLGAIRRYNKYNLYTSWAGLTLAGTSEFISDGYGIARVDNKSYFPLGCGPGNMNWKECNERRLDKKACTW